MRAVMIAILALLGAGPVMSQENGLITRPSRYAFDETLTRLEASIRQSQYRVLGRLDHAAAAREVGLAMPPAVVVVFGNPRLGTPEFLRHPTLAIGLPLKALVWQDGEGHVWVSINSADYVLRTLYPRHGAGPVPDDTVRGVDATITQIVARALE
jgi:uncharacterized protein (DUF302 family)